MVHIFFLLFPVLILSQTQSRELITKKDSLLPGTSTSISFILENPTSENKKYTIEAATFSPTIISILSKGESSISSGESKGYIVPIRIVTEAAKGKYSIIIKIRETNSQKNRCYYFRKQ